LRAETSSGAKWLRAAAACWRNLMANLNICSIPFLLVVQYCFAVSCAIFSVCSQTKWPSNDMQFPGQRKKAGAKTRPRPATLPPVYSPRGNFAFFLQYCWCRLIDVVKVVKESACAPKAN